VLGANNLLYSRDLFGAAVDRAEARLGASVVLFNGAGADVSTRFTRRAQSQDEVARLGTALGDAIAAAAAQARPVAAPAAAGGLAGATLAARSRHVAIRLRSLEAEPAAAARVQEVAAAVERGRAEGLSPAALRLRLSRLEGAMARLWLARGGGWEALLGRLPQQAEVQEIRGGEFRLLAAPGEMFSASGRRLCGATAGGALVVGYANDYLGYLVPPECAGGGDYEALMAALEPDSAAAVERALAEMCADG
jgi:hypothetical protein